MVETITPARHWQGRILVMVCGLLAAILFPLATTSPAHAFSQAFWPTQSKGNKGADVTAIQYLLVHAGHSIAVDGDFGSGTEAAVRSFQGAKGLGADGVVGPNTWGALTVTLRQGSINTAVKALQYQLNIKHNAGLAVDGNFGSGTRTAVERFQSHAGIGVDGVVGQTTWRNLIWHYAKMDRPDATGVCTYGASSENWGTGAAVGQLTVAASRTYNAGYGRVAFGDLSLEHGGDIAGHASHEVGLDADIRPIRKDRQQCSGGTNTGSSNYDRAATRELIKHIRATGRVKVIFFNDQQLINEGLVTYWANHYDHLHVRYCERVHPNSKYDC
ncbi:MAG: penicillin-insensitive murein endopeptidase [Micromonosporaceae bacterium]